MHTAVRDRYNHHHHHLLASPLWVLAFLSSFSHSSLCLACLLLYLSPTLSQSLSTPCNHLIFVFQCHFFFMAWPRISFLELFHTCPCNIFIIILYILLDIFYYTFYYFRIISSKYHPPVMAQRCVQEFVLQTKEQSVRLP